MMTNGDPEGRIFVYQPHTNNGFLYILQLGTNELRITLQLGMNELPITRTATRDK